MRNFGKRIKLFGGISCPESSYDYLDGHKKGNIITIARLLKISKEFSGVYEVISFLSTLKLRPGLAVELADCALSNNLTQEKIGLSPVAALGDDTNDIGNHCWPIYSESKDRLCASLRTGHIEKGKRFHPNEWWYLCFKK